MVKSEYNGTYRHFTMSEVDGKIVNIGTVKIKEHQTPIDAAKKILSCYCRHENIKSNRRNKVNIKFTIVETTRGHSKIYGPYKGYFVKYDKPVIIKLKNGKVIKKTLKPVVKLDNSIQTGGDCNPKIYQSTNLCGTKQCIKVTNEELKNIIFFIRTNSSYDCLEKYYDYFKGIKGSSPDLLSLLDVSEVTDMSNLFLNFDFKINNSEDYYNITDWDVTKVTDMSHMFFNSRNFNQNLSRWNVSNVKNMSYMFYNCVDFYVNNINLFFWNVNPETKLNNMFAYCNNLFKKKSFWSLKGNHYKLIDYVKIEKNNVKYNPKYIIENEEWKLYQDNKNDNDLENPKNPTNIKKCLKNTEKSKNNINKCIYT